MRVENGNNASGAGVMMSAALLGQSEDAQSKSIRKQIEEKQQELSELSSKEDMSSEEKMKKRQELTKEISDLNMQLRQHQMEKRMQEKAEKQKQSQNAQNAGSASKGKGKTQAAGFSTEGMSAMLSADTSMKQAKVQGSVSNKMENRAAVLESEIKLDSARGGSTERKEAELAGVEAKAVSAAVAQAGSLREANESAREASEAERSNIAERTEKTEHSGQSKNAEKVNTEETDSAKKNPAQKAEAEQDENKNAQGMAEKSQSELYPPVDVRI